MVVGMGIQARALTRTKKSVIHRLELLEEISGGAFISFLADSDRRREDPHLDPCHPNIEGCTFDIESHLRICLDIEYFDILCTFDIEVLHLRYRALIFKLFDIEGHKYQYQRSIFKVTNINNSKL